jgi:DNA-binding transcriptional ArsR family regulator
MTVWTVIKMDTMVENLDDTLIKALSNPERKNILRIVASHPEGVNYTGILEQSQLSTGRLNYHLGALTGFLEKREERLYSLTELGKTAIAVLDFMLEDVGASVLNSVDKRKAKRLASIKRSMDYGFYFLVFISIGITAYMGTIAEKGNPTWGVLTGFWVMFAIGLIYLFNRSRKKDAEKILWLIDWIKWRFLGNYRMRGQV